MKPARLESFGLVIVVLGVAALTTAAYLLAGVAVALVVLGVALTVGGLFAVKAAAVSERGGK